MTNKRKARASAAGDGEVEEATAARAAVGAGGVEVDLIEKLGGTPDKMISQGAEGRVFRVQFLQRATVVKQRFKKTYRHPTLDAKLTRSRLTMETRSLMRARKLGVVTPTIYYVDTQQSAIYMEHVEGKSLKEHIRAGMSEEDMRSVGAQVGRAVAALHDGGLIHGDLTTSNILVRESDKRVVIIDFGLAQNSIIPEDKGVDLYVLVRIDAGWTEPTTHHYDPARCAKTPKFQTVVKCFCIPPTPIKTMGPSSRVLLNDSAR